jgi:hypothetical protein
MMTALAMERKFQLNQTGQASDLSRFGQEEFRHLSHPVLAA